MAAALTKPAVLAAAKDALYPDLDTRTDHYLSNDWALEHSVNLRHFN